MLAYTETKCSSDTQDNIKSHHFCMLNLSSIWYCLYKYVIHAHNLRHYLIMNKVSTTIRYASPFAMTYVHRELTSLQQHHNVTCNCENSSDLQETICLHTYQVSTPQQVYQRDAEDQVLYHSLSMVGAQGSCHVQ